MNMEKKNDGQLLQTCYVLEFSKAYFRSPGYQQSRSNVEKVCAELDIPCHVLHLPLYDNPDSCVYMVSKVARLLANAPDVSMEEKLKLPWLRQRFVENGFTFNRAGLLDDKSILRLHAEFGFLRFQEKFMKMRNAEMAFQNEIKQKEQKATQEIAIKASKIVQGIAEKKKLQMVFETHSAGLVYVSKPVDLTDEVIAAYSKQGKTISKK